MAIERIITQSSKTFSGMDILGIVLHAKQGLTVLELQHALAFRVGDASLECLSKRLVPKAELLKRTSGLLTIRDGDEVQLVHQSVYQYLHGEAVYADHFSGKERHLADICLHYIQLPDFQKMYDTELERNAHQPFLHYAVWHLGHHVASCLEMDGHDDLVHDLLRLLEKKDELPLGTLQVVATKVMQRPRSGRIDKWRKAMSSLHMAIVWDMDAVVKELMLRNPESINLITEGDKHETPLHVAARSSNIMAVELLLEQGANINAVNYSGKNALDMIMMKPYMQVQTKMGKETDFGNLLVELLLLRITVTGRVVDHPPQSRIDRATFGHEQIAKESFLQGFQDADFGSDEHKQSMRNSTNLILSNALDMDITDDEERIALLLIRKGIRVNAKDCKMETPLQLAALYGRRKIVKKLLEKDSTNPFIDRTLGWTASQLALSRSHDDIWLMISLREKKLRQKQDSAFDEEAKLSTYAYIPIMKTID